MMEGAMPKLKNGHCVYLAGLRFEYDHRGCVPRVRVFDTEGKHDEITTFGVELLTSEQDLEKEAAWWVYQNNPRAL
jgi:hypothetical protein